MQEFSTTELVRNTAQVMKAASRKPVVITHRKKPRFVMMNFGTFGVLRGPDQRRAYSVEDTPDDVAEWLLPALDAVAAGAGHDD